MQQPKAVIKQAWPYQKDSMHLPVDDLETALPFYEQVLGFKVVSRPDTPYKSAIIIRDSVHLGLVENGGDPTQDGCFFEVDNVVNALAELKANGLAQTDEFSVQQHGSVTWKVFFVVAPDGLCYCYGQRQQS